MYLKQSTLLEVDLMVRKDTAWWWPCTAGDSHSLVPYKHWQTGYYYLHRQTWPLLPFCTDTLAVTAFYLGFLSTHPKGHEDSLDRNLCPLRSSGHNSLENSLWGAVPDQDMLLKAMNSPPSVSASFPATGYMGHTPTLQPLMTQAGKPKKGSVRILGWVASGQTAASPKVRAAP